MAMEILEVLGFTPDTDVSQFLGYRPVQARTADLSIDGQSYDQVLEFQKNALRDKELLERAKKSAVAQTIKGLFMAVGVPVGTVGGGVAGAVIGGGGVYLVGAGISKIIETASGVPLPDVSQFISLPVSELNSYGSELVGNLQIFSANLTSAFPDYLLDNATSVVNGASAFVSSVQSSVETSVVSYLGGIGGSIGGGGYLGRKALEFSIQKSSQFGDTVGTKVALPWERLLSHLPRPRLERLIPFKNADG